MSLHDRSAGYLPIGSYAALGDGRTVALVAADGAIDWLPIPVLDAPPAFAAILGPETGGSFQLEPIEAYTVQRSYVPETAVLVTTFSTASGSVAVTDSLNRQGGHPLPWTELARVVRARRGAVRMRWRIAPGRRFGSAEPWSTARRGVPLIELGDQMLAVVTDRAGKPHIAPHHVSGEFTAIPGETCLLALVATDEEPVLVPSPAEIGHRASTTAGEWQDWRRTIRYSGPHADAVARSGLTLRLLTIAAVGANAAAATTSLPEAIGGERNYDYRFAWVRDASLALDALTSLGLMEEVHSALSWLLHAVARTAPDVHVFYTLGGQPAPPDVQEITTMPGYRHTGPVRSGNPAAGQLQLGAYGHLLKAVYKYVRHGGQLGPATGSVLAGMADRVCDRWHQPDAGMWELGDYQHYTSSKLGCWVALDRAARLAHAGQLPSWHASRWTAAAAEIRAWVNECCWSAAKDSYTMYAGTEDLDAAVLLAARTGFCDPDKSRLRTTIDAIRRELTATSPLLYRYSSVRGKEGAFAACTFWLTEALVCDGRIDEAEAVFAGMLG
ncbi:MAG: glycoside hydrolase family 15 protein, partial [Actinobacteria bacterium]|nr:glycoside hydrolase family 15 protein [Actinomycetota bacterium]